MFGAGDLGTTLKVIHSVRAGKTVWAPPGGTNVVDVRDVSRGIVALLKAGLVDGEYILSSWNITYKDMFDTIAIQTGDARPKRVVPHFLLPLLYWSVRILEIVNPRIMGLTASGVDSWFRYRYFDSSKATAAIGWRPEFTFADSIQYSLTWLKENDLV
jgi:dihydroflavonol-4-reductase